MSFRAPFVFFGLLSLAAGCMPTEATVEVDDPLGEGEASAQAEQGVTVAAGFTDTLVTQGLTNPTTMEFAPDGRLFVAEQAGRLRIIKNGALLTAPFISLTVSSVGERGLLGIAFDPAFATNKFVYLYYTTTSPAVHNRVSRFTANGDVAVAGSERVLIDLPNLSSATNHNGGAIHFGPDGKLYIAVGENANRNNAPLLTTTLGKMLRINSDGTIPTDNPFAAQTTGQSKAIWAIGLRNPFNFAFQPGTGRMALNDVGEFTWEEINDGVAGSHYGWPTTEGRTTDSRFRGPLFVYGHGTSTTTGCAIVGGAFYNPLAVRFPSTMLGAYFYADACSGWIRRVNLATGTSTGFATGLSFPVDVKVGDDGALYYATRGDGAVHRISVSTVVTPPTLTLQPEGRTVQVGQQVTFNVTASGTAPLRFQWQRNGLAITGATSSAFTLAAAQVADDGARFRCVVSNGGGTATSAEATLRVTSVSCPNTCVEHNGPLAACGTCITAVCQRDSYCCTTRWDKICVREASETCAGGCTAAAVSFANEIQPIFEARCGTCHVATNLGNLSLARGQARGELVGVPSACNTAIARVQPFSLVNSMLWRKLAADSTMCGGAMPLGSAALKVVAPDELGKIELWLMQGARDN